MVKFLKPRLFEVTYIKLNSERPNEYSYFKIGIHEVNADEFVKPKI